MLKYKINVKRKKTKNEPLNCTSMVHDEHFGSDIFSINTAETRLTATTLSFIRSDGNDIFYADERVVDREEPNSYIVPIFKDIVLSASSACTVVCGGERYILLILSNFHYLNRNRDDVFTKFVLINEDETPEEKGVCNGDYFVKDSYFLYLQSGETEVCMNTESILYWEDSFKNVHEENVIVPCTYAGKDMKMSLLLEYNENTKDILLNYSNWKIWVKDQRFFKYEIIENGIWGLSFQDGANIYMRTGDIKIDMPILEDFYPALMKEDGIDDYLKSEAEKKITPAVDYEKQQFVPVYSGYDITKITFVTHILEKDDEWNTVKNGKWIPSTHEQKGLSSKTEIIAKLKWDVGDYIDETVNWYDSSKNELKGTGIWVLRERNGTSGWITLATISDVFSLPSFTFNSEDIYYRKKKVSETFLRLSFYDIPNRTTQKLLYTCKIYLNENKLWTTYVEGGEKITGCHAMFECTDKNNYNSSTEGFYLHLFPSNLKENTGDSIIYMKAELNNAKYGKTIPMTLPISENKINPVICTADENTQWLSNDNRSYTTDDGSGNVYTDMSSLSRDMYIKIHIRYNPDNLRYEWEFPILNHVNGDNSFNEEEKSIILPLYEPRIDYVPNGNN